METSARNMLNRTFWSVFNVALRLVGLYLVVLAAILLIGVFSDSGEDGLLLAILAAIVATLAAAMLRVRAFRPDIDGYRSAFGGQVAGQRGWWTGSVK